MSAKSSGLRGARFGIFLAELGEGFFDGVKRGIGFLRHQAREKLVAVLQGVVIVGLDILARSLSC